jgi:hypothetical protein
VSTTGSGQPEREEEGGAVTATKGEKHALRGDISCFNSFASPDAY